MLANDPGGDLHPRIKTQLVHDVFDVFFDGAFTEDEGGSDEGIALSLSQQGSDFMLASGEAATGGSPAFGGLGQVVMNHLAKRVGQSRIR